MQKNDRLERCREILKEKHIAGLLVSDPVDLYYLTGYDLSAGRILITPSVNYLFVDGRYYEACKELPFDVFLAKKYDRESVFAEKVNELKGAIGFDSTTTSYAAWEELAKIIDERLEPLDYPIKKLRSCKDEGEITTLRRAATLACEGVASIMELFREGITEEEIALELEIFWRRKGGQKLAFSSIIAFGENSAIPHHRANKKKLKQGDLILIDVGVVLGHYHSDMTRVFSFGKPDGELAKIYEIVYKANREAIALCKANVPISEVDQRARKVISDAGYGDKFTHSLGHGVGLEIHELPVLRSDSVGTLKENMVVTIEPGIYLPFLGGVRLEDMILITEDGYENLTPTLDFPKLHQL